MKRMKDALFALGITTLSALFGSFEGAAAPSSPPSTLLTIFLKHDQGKNLEEIQKNLASNRFYEVFPPLGTTIVDWHVVMGIGQILVLEVQDARIAEVQSKLKEVASGAFTTETFRTENLYPKVLEKLANKSKASLGEKPLAPGSMLLTIVLRPRPGRTKAFAAILASKQKLYENFPPAGATVINWYDASDLGEIVVLEFPASLLRTVNLSLERFAWKAYTTDFYASYDFYGPARDSFHLKNTAKKSL